MLALLLIVCSRNSFLKCSPLSFLDNIIPCLPFSSAERVSLALSGCLAQHWRHGIVMNPFLPVTLGLWQSHVTRAEQNSWSTLVNLAPTCLSLLLRLCRGLFLPSLLLRFLPTPLMYSSPFFIFVSPTRLFYSASLTLRTIFLFFVCQTANFPSFKSLL